jgi:hypothetical protein
MCATHLKEIAGYTFGTSDVPVSPISLKDLELLKQTVLFTRDDERYLRTAGQVLAGQIDAILDVWYNFIGIHPHLARYFARPNGQLDAHYLSNVRERFGQWILDTCNRPYDQDWLNYQYEIALRHYRAKKNKTDHVDSAPIIHLRYLIAFIFPITATVKPFLAAKGHSALDVEKMFNAWFKAVNLHIALWSFPYVDREDF